MTTEAIDKLNWTLINVSYKYCDPNGEASKEDKKIFSPILHEFSSLLRNCNFSEKIYTLTFSKKYETSVMYQLFNELELEIKELKHTGSKTIITICFQN